MEVSESQVSLLCERCKTHQDKTDLTFATQQPRASKIGRLPVPSTTYSGLTELSDSQNNSRMQIPQPMPAYSTKGVKRETPQPGTIENCPSWTIVA